MTAPVDIISSNTIWLWESLGRQALTSEPPPPSHSINRMPPTPAGFSLPSPGPVMNPSRDIAIYKITRDMTPLRVRVRWIAGTPHPAAVAGLLWLGPARARWPRHPHAAAP